jgi:type I restriction enzyme, S subunit
MDGRDLSSCHLQAHDVLVASLGNPTGRACVVTAVSLPGINKADCFRVRLSQRVSPEYVCIALNAPSSLRRAAELNRGDTRGRINLQHLKSTVIHLPPSAEQARIVLKVSQLLAICDRLDHAITSQGQRHREVAAATPTRSTDI